MENTKTLLSFLEEKNYQKLRELLIETPPADIAILFDDLPSGRCPFYSVFCQRNRLPRYSSNSALICRSF